MHNKSKTILDLCGGTGSWSRPYEEEGYDVRIITLPVYDVTQTEFMEDRMVFKNDASPCESWMVVYYNEVYGVLAAPPCTEFSVLNCIAAPRERDEVAGMEVVNACLKIIERCAPKFWALENPVGYLRKHMPNPKLTFQPWWYGDGWTKRTDIWGNFNIPERTYKDWDDVPKIDIYTRPGRGKPNFAFLHKSAQQNIPQLKGIPVASDAEFRAITPPGFAKAFYEANK